MRHFKLTIIAIALLFMQSNAFSAIVLGNPKGKTSLTFVYDYQCIHCHHMYPVIGQIAHSNPKIKIRMQPVAILNKASLIEAAAAIASATSIKGFVDFTSSVMIHPPLSETNAQKWTQMIAQKHPRFFERMKSKAVEEQLQEGLNLLQQNKSRSVPLIIISNDDTKKEIVIRGETSFNAIQRDIHELNKPV